MTSDCLITPQGEYITTVDMVLSALDRWNARNDGHHTEKRTTRRFPFRGIVRITAAYSGQVVHFEAPTRDISVNGMCFLVARRIRTDLLDLGGLKIAGWSPTPVPDDFDATRDAIRKMYRYVVYDGPTLLERLIATITASIIAIRQRNFETFTQWHVVGRTSAQTAEASPADLIKLDNNGVAGWIAGQAVKATPQAAQQITASVVQRTSSAFQPDEPPELILLNDPAQRQYLEAALERAR